MDRLLFSKDNFNVIYKILQNKIQSSLKVNIDTDPKFHKELINIIKSIYQQRGTFNYPSNLSHLDTSRYLSQKSINVALRYFTDTIKKTTRNVNVDHLSRDMNNASREQTNILDRRPTDTGKQYGHTNGSSSVVSDYNRIINERDTSSNNFPKPVNFKEPSAVSNNDIKNRYESLNQNRQSDYDSLEKSGATSQNSSNNHNIGTMSTQSNYLNNPPNNEIHELMKQQQELQRKINSMQNSSSRNNSNPDETAFIPPVQMTPNDDSALNAQFNNSNSPAFKPPSQQNPQFISEDNKPINNILENQFTSLIDMDEDTDVSVNKPTEAIKEMEPDTNIDYDSLLENITNSSEMTNNSINEHFMTSVQNMASDEDNVSTIFPKSMISEARDITDTNRNNVSNNAAADHELSIIKTSLKQQTTNLVNTDNIVNDMVKSMETLDLPKFYNTIMDIPRLIKEQKTIPLTIRTHNLIISSRDRDLTNIDFDKYNFRVVFGAEGDQTTESAGSSDTKFTSSGLRNPTVQQVLKNIISIKLKRVVIPKPPSDHEWIPEPYLFLSVDEFGSNIISTKHFSDKIFCKIHYDKEFGLGDGRQYLYYKNDDDDFTMFYPSPLGKLDRLTLKLLNSDGTNAKTSFNDTDVSNPPYTSIAPILSYDKIGIISGNSFINYNDTDSSSFLSTRRYTAIGKGDDGTFKLSFGEATTTAIDFDASNTDVRRALTTLSSVASCSVTFSDGEVAVTDGDINIMTFVITPNMTTMPLLGNKVILKAVDITGDGISFSQDNFTLRAVGPAATLTKSYYYAARVNSNTYTLHTAEPVTSENLVTFSSDLGYLQSLEIEVINSKDSIITTRSGNISLGTIGDSAGNITADENHSFTTVVLSVKHFERSQENTLLAIEAATDAATEFSVLYDTLGDLIIELNKAELNMVKIKAEATKIKSDVEESNSIIEIANEATLLSNIVIANINTSYGISPDESVFEQVSTELVDVTRRLFNLSNNITTIIQKVDLISDDAKQLKEYIDDGSDLKGEALIITSNAPSSIIDIDLPTSNKVKIVSNHSLVNLSNQLEYIFEVKTQEHDPTSELRPIL
tara:strand:- start:7802 stop:11047 length:3246 start_codon:yes stop_codon:yes gene_type:complete